MGNFAKNLNLGNRFWPPPPTFWKHPNFIVEMSREKGINEMLTFEGNSCLSPLYF